MVKNILRKYLVDKKKSFMIGDKVSDKKCAQNSNLKFEYAKNNFESLVKKIVKEF